MPDSTPLTDIFGTTKASVLEVLIRVDDELTIRHIARLCDRSPGAAGRALEELERNLMVTCRVVSGMHLYKLNTKNSFVPFLKALVEES